MTTKLTKTLVESITPSDEPGKRLLVWDASVPGFGLVVLPTGVRSFIYQYRNREGRTRRYTIGRLSDALTCEQARKIAREKAVEVHNGVDPMGVKSARRTALTVNELLNLYLESSAFAQKAASTKAIDRGRIQRHVRPLLGGQHADQLTADTIRRAQSAIAEGQTAGTVKTTARGVARVTGGRGTADKAVLALRAAYSWAVAEGILKENPAASVKVAQPGQRDTILHGTGAYASLFRTLATMENEHRIRPAAADAIRFIALTGARRGEVANLGWDHVDFRSGQIAIPPTAHKTGSRTGKPRIISLPAEAQAIIARQNAGDTTGYVFKAAKGAGPLSLAKPWVQVHAEAGLPAGLGLHGLRHSLASHLAMAGASACELMEVLGHRQMSTTQRYIHFAEKSRSTLAERGAAMALAGMAEARDEPKADVVPMTSAR
ncbi:site-specific integrase [Accumulibacter sp.]|uniref:site-specific integrase n=1 Tax=Accumulibacter sp. TaxID=2053492 RepID=UPI001AC44BA5|nr:site-specific integrase [Accumulibacter sp.]MBN8516240.1 site-specific integrase [Accumulibacter sp.]MBO3701587.1 site-specific integrase [Accumulibacter sp.]HRI91361.1 site-specific integrase [Accumulibacter sp.]